MTTASSARPGAKQRAVVVGASSGMGAAVVARFAAEGIETVALDLPGATWPEELPPVRTGPIDVSEPGTVEEAFADAAAFLGSVEIVVNCAGILGAVEATAEVSHEAFSKIVSVNLGGAFAVTQAALGLMLPNHHGRIVHIASIAGKEGNPQMAAYSASKAGVIGLVKSTGKEYAASGVTVNAIAPASIETPLIQGMTPERRSAQKALIPMGRFGTVEEVAGLVSHVVSPETSFTTGFVYDLSGGRADY